MSLDLLTRARPAWEASEAPDLLERILDDGVHLTLWQRPRPASLGWLDTFDLDEVDDVQDALAVAGLGACIPGLLAAAGYPDHEGTAALASEISATARRFARIMATRTLRLRLEVVETNACRKFHMDNVKARLLMPLTDPGTQWVEAGAGDEAPVHQLRAGHVGLFKGRMWTDAPAILHRSPPIAGLGVSRLLLVLDLPHTAAPDRPTGGAAST